MILYVLIVLILASFVFTFLSARTWHWGYVLLVEALFLATLGFFVLGAETLRINAVLRSQINKDDKAFSDAQAEVDALRNGTKNPAILNRLRGLDPPAKMPEDAESIASFATLDHELLILTRRRGRVWRNVTPAGMNPQTGAIQVNIPAPTPAGVNKDTVVFVFDEGPPQPPAPNGALRGPQYLGEFTVAQAAGQQVSLLPVRPLLPNDYEFRRLSASRGPWIMYETMPGDEYAVFAGLTEDQLKQILPKQSVAEYVRHGQPATDADDPMRKVGFDADGKALAPEQLGTAAKVLYQRRLRDYATEFDQQIRRHINMVAEAEAIRKDIDQLTAANEVGKKLQALRTEERQKLSADLAGVTKERQAVEQHLAQLQQLLNKARQLTAAAQSQNRALVEELTARQIGIVVPVENGASLPARRSERLAFGK